MNPERWARVKELFAEARMTPVPQRGAWIEAACGSDDALRDELLALLAGDGADDFLEPPAPDDVAGALAVADDEILPPGAMLGRYELGALIATGGMGAVYRARRGDDAFEKDVAIKVIRRGMLTSRLRARFHRERQVLAQLDHPNITRLLDGGTSPAGLPYLVMELVEGRRIDRYCAERDLGVRERLTLFLDVCSAVQAAHRRLVVHRDLKPGNILVTEDGTVKLLDFGIARLLEATDAAPAGATLTGFLPLTPEYASPEQLRGEPVTTASDVYSLGVVLYELLADRRPHDLEGAARYEAARTVCEVDPGPPSGAVESARRRRALRGDLDTIVLTALRRDAARRYASVEQLRGDVERWLTGLPITARRDSRWYRVRKLAWRHRLQVGAAALAAAALLALTAGMAVSLERARTEGRRADDARIASEETLGFYEAMLLRSNPYRTGRNVTVLDLLAEAETALRTSPPDRPEVEAGVCVAIGRAYANLMQWPRAVPHLERAHRLYATLPHASDDARAECLALLGRARSQTRQHGALDLQREALAIRRRLHGDEHPLVAESIGLVGYALWTNHGRPPRYDEAERHYLDAIAMYERLGLAVSADAARFTMSLAFMHDCRDRRADAEAHYHAAIEIYDALPVTEDLYRMAAMSLLADLLARDGRWAEALAIVERQLRLMPDDFDLERRATLEARLAEWGEIDG